MRDRRSPARGSVPSVTVFLRPARRDRRGPGRPALPTPRLRTPDRVAQQLRVTRRVERRPVVKGVGVAGQLDAVVAWGPLPGSTFRLAAPPARARARWTGRCRSGRRPGSPAAGTASGSRSRAPKHLRRQRLLGPEGRLKRRPEPIQECDPAGDDASSTWASVTCASVATVARGGDRAPSSARRTAARLGRRAAGRRRPDQTRCCRASIPTGRGRGRPASRSRPTPQPARRHRQPPRRSRAAESGAAPVGAVGGMLRRRHANPSSNRMTLSPVRDPRDREGAGERQPDHGQRDLAGAGTQRQRR